MTVDVGKLRHLLCNATKRPWSVMFDEQSADRVMGIYGAEHVTDYGSGPETFRDRIVETDCGYYEPEKVDAELIVEAVNALGELLDERTQLRQVRELAWKMLNGHTGDAHCQAGDCDNCGAREAEAELRSLLA